MPNVPLNMKHQINNAALIKNLMNQNRNLMLQQQKFVNYMRSNRSSRSSHFSNLDDNSSEISDTDCINMRNQMNRNYFRDDLSVYSRDSKVSKNSVKVIDMKPEINSIKSSSHKSSKMLYNNEIDLAKDKILLMEDRYLGLHEEIFRLKINKWKMR